MGSLVLLIGIVIAVYFALFKLGRFSKQENARLYLCKKFRVNSLSELNKEETLEAYEQMYYLSNRDEKEICQFSESLEQLGWL